MAWLARLRRYLRDAWHGRAIGREIDEELQFHIDTLVEELVARGRDPHEARQEAARRLGSIELVRDEGRYVKGIGLADALRQDVRYGLRLFLRQPGFNPGFDPDHVVTMQVSLPAARYATGIQVASFYRQLIERIERTPGVGAAAVSLGLAPHLLR